MAEVDDRCDTNVNVIEEDDRENCSLFLGDLSIFCEEKDIEEAFAQFGEIVDVRIQRSKETARALSYGFIQFAEAASAEAASNSMNYFLLKGRPLRIRWAASRKNPIKSVATPHDSAATVYVRFMSQSSEAVVSEETLRILFNNYGPVFDCAIKKLSQDTKTNRTKGYAFVSFDSGALIHGGVDAAGVDAAYRASVDLRNRVVNNIRYRCELGYRLHKQYASLTQQTYMNAPVQEAPMPVPVAMPMPVPMQMPTMVPVACVPQPYGGYQQQQYSAPQQQYSSPRHYQESAQSHENAQQQAHMQSQQQQAQMQSQQQQQAQMQSQQQQMGSPTHGVAPQMQYAAPRQQAPQQQMPQQAAQYAYQQAYGPYSSSFSPTHMVSQILNSNRSPTNYEMQLLRAMTPRNGVPMQAQQYAAPQYAPYMTQQQGVQQHQGYATSATMMVSPAQTPSHAAMMQQQGYMSPPPQQAPMVAPQYMYPYYTSASNTPTHANPEIGLRALQARSVSGEGNAVSYGTQQTASMVMQMPMMMQQGGMPQLAPINTSAGYVQVMPQYQQQAPQQQMPQQVSQQPHSPTDQQQQQPMSPQSGAATPLGKAYAPPTPRGSCSEYFSAVTGLSLKVSTDPVQHMEQPAVLVQHLAGSRDNTPKSMYTTRRSTPSARGAYGGRSPTHMQMVMAQQLHMQQALVQQMQLNGAYQDPRKGPPSRRSSSDSTGTAPLYVNQGGMEEDGMRNVGSDSTDVMMPAGEVAAN